MKCSAVLSPFVLASVLVAVPAAAEAGHKLKIDRDHSSVGFSVRHLFTRVQGRFTRFSGTVDFNDQAVEASKVAATIQAASVDTNVAARDEDLRSKRFFDSQRFSTIDFHHHQDRETER
jgi:polyisoprenoid-binding protein YceI